jgi:2-aminoadipate transaminase
MYAERIKIMGDEVKKLNSLAGSITALDMISFAVGAPAKEAYPIDIVREISQDIFSKETRGYEAFRYGPTQGFQDLREAVRDNLLTPRGLDVNADNIIITSGGIQPMSLLCQLFINPGDVILVEAPTFVHSTMIFKMFEATIIPCNMDENGLIMEEIEDKIKQYKPKMIYTMPTFQNPTGITMSVARRKRLAELGSKYDVIILEDDPYREIRYDGVHLPTIKSFDQTGNTVFVNSLSKIFSPGSRLGYLVASDDIITHLKSIKLGFDTSASTFAQIISAEFFKRGYYKQHLENLCTMYKIRRDAMIESIDKYFPDETKHTNPDGGFYVWVELPKNLDAWHLADEISNTLNITYGIGTAFYSEGNPEGSGKNCMRLNFTGLTEDVIRENIEMLGDFFKSKI